MHMIISTTPQIEGHPVKVYHGIVTGETIIGANLFRDLFASIRDVVGGRSGAYEEVLPGSQETTFEEIKSVQNEERMRWLASIWITKWWEKAAVCSW